MIERIEKNENFPLTEDTGSLERSSAMMEHLGYIVFTGIFWSCFFGYLLDKSNFFLIIVAKEGKDKIKLQSCLVQSYLDCQSCLVCAQEYVPFINSYS